MVDRMMFSIMFQGLVPSEGIRVVDRPLPCLGLNMLHQFIRTDGIDDFGVGAVFPLQKPKHDAFPGGGSSTFALPFSSKVPFVQFNLTFEFASLQLGQMKQGFSQSLVDVCDDFDIDAQIRGQPIGGLQLIEALQDRNLSTQTTQALALLTLSIGISHTRNWCAGP